MTAISDAKSISYYTSPRGVTPSDSHHDDLRFSSVFIAYISTDSSHNITRLCATALINEIRKILMRAPNTPSLSSFQNMGPSPRVIQKPSQGPEPSHEPETRPDIGVVSETQEGNIV